MKYPSLIINPKTPISGELHGAEISATGVPVAEKFSAVCIFQDADAKRVYTKEKTEVILSAEAYISGNICENLKEITGGEVKVFDTSYTVAKCSRKRNPDGSINFVRLGLI